MTFTIELTEDERRFVLGAVKYWSGKYDAFGQSLVRRLSRPDNLNDGATAADGACEDIGED